MRTVFAIALKIEAKVTRDFLLGRDFSLGREVPSNVDAEPKRLVRSLIAAMYVHDVQNAMESLTCSSAI